MRKMKRWLALVCLPVLAVSVATAPGARADQVFPQTGMRLWGPFENYWQAHGGIDQFGIPRTGVFSTGEGYDTQWFERALFTYNPRNPDPHKVQLQLLGAMATEHRRSEPPFRSATPSGQGHFFEATKHNLSGKFLERWRTTGGLAIYGYPISEPFMERSKLDGKEYLVQYFERNRFELHPELAGTRYEVQLGLLGSELLDAQGGPASVANLGAPTFYPQPSGAAVPPGSVVTSPGMGTPSTSAPAQVPQAPTLPATGKQIHFQDDFSSASLDASRWEVAAPLDPRGAIPAEWRVRDGMLEQHGSHRDQGTAEEAVLLAQPTWSALGGFVLDFYFYATGAEAVGAAFQTGDVDVPSSYGLYVVKLYAQAPNQSPKASLVRTNPGPSATIAQSSTWSGYSRGAWHRFTVTRTVTREGAEVRVAVDGEPVLQTRDAGFRPFNFGLYTYADGTSKFDNVRLSAP